MSAEGSFKQAASSEAPSLLSALGILGTAFFYLVILPLKLLFGQALPWILINLFNVVLYILSCLWAVVRISLWPVLFPLDILFIRPATAILLLIYQSRYILLFIVMALLFGTAMGYLSSALTSSQQKARSSPPKSYPKKSERTQRQQISSSEPKQPVESSSDDEIVGMEAQKSKLNSRHVKDRSDEDRFAAAMQSLAERRRRIVSMS